MLQKIKKIINRFFLLCVKNRSYKFFIEKLEAEPEIALAHDFFASEYFRQNLKPLPIDTSRLKNIVVFAPHQDDEVIGMGGLLSSLHQQQTKITLVFLTDGESLQYNQSKIRAKEASLVGDILKATIEEINISNVTLEVSREHLKKILTILERESPDAIFTVWPLDAPFKHRFCNAVLAQALSIDNGWTSRKRQLPVYAYQVHSALLPNLYFDYTHFLEEKMALLSIYSSQLRTQNYLHLSKGLDAWNSRYLPPSTEKRYVELFTSLPLESYVEMVKIFYDSNPKQAFKGNQVCIDAYKKLRRIE